MNIEQELPVKHKYAVLDDHFVLGIPVLDSQHANLFRMSSNLFQTCLKSAGIADFRLARALDEALNHLYHHSRTEEKLMGLSEFPEYFEHKKEHEEIMAEILIRSGEFQERGDPCSADFTDFLKDAIERHVAFSDRRFADFFHRMKHHGKLKLILSETSCAARERPF